MRVPTATYRLQLHKGFGFSQVKELIDYLYDLGISDIYASPIFKARAGSLHGYDVVNPNEINPELGSPDEFGALSEELRRRDMGWLQDIVPNHMAYDCENGMLMDVLENGLNSGYADFFDIEWDHPVESMRGKVLAPSLGQFYGQCLENGELVLKYDAQGLAIHYYQQRFPINVESYAQVMAPSVRELRRELGPQHPDLIKLLGDFSASMISSRFVWRTREFLTRRMRCCLSLSAIERLPDYASTTSMGFTIRRL